MPSTRVTRLAQANKGSPHNQTQTWLGVATGTWDRPVIVVPFACRLVGASFASDTTAGIDGTNYWSMVLNDGSDNLTSALTNAAVAFTADTEREFVLVAAQVVLAAGDYIRIVGTDVGGGNPTSWAAAYLAVNIEYVPI